MDADTQAVINKVTDDGTIDEIRRKVVDALKKDEGLKKMVFDMVENSQALSSSDNLKLNKRQLLEVLRKELEQDLMDHASRAAWEIMSSPTSNVSSYIDNKVHEALCIVHQERREQTATATTSFATAGYTVPYTAQTSQYGPQYMGFGPQPGAAASGQPQPAYGAQQMYQQQYAQQYGTAVYGQQQAAQASAYGMYQPPAGSNQLQYMQQYSQQAHRGK